MPEQNTPADAEVPDFSHLGERRRITIAEEAWLPYVDDSGFVPEGAFTKPLMDPATGHTFLAAKFEPNFVAPSHWHPSDTIYIITSGEFIIEGEGSYGPGDVRWVKGGTAYGREQAGPEGVEFLLVSLGEFDLVNPEERTPPQGHWHENPPA